MFNQVFEKLLVYAPDSGVTSSQRLETVLGRASTAPVVTPKKSRAM
jgi:hypothetical protein